MGVNYFTEEQLKALRNNPYIEKAITYTEEFFYKYSLVYYVCFNSYRKKLRDMKKDILYGLMSLDVPIVEGITMVDVLGMEGVTIDKAHINNEIEFILRIVNALNDEAKNLIIQLYYNDKKEKELAQYYQVI